MPITINQPITPLSEQEFHDLDFQVMRLAFDAHNRLGRFYNEQIYKNELLKLCHQNGLAAKTEVQIQLKHGSFSKNLFIDLLIENSSVYELKAAKIIAPSYRTQTLDYLFLTHTKHGKIINFRPPSVEHEFVSTTLTHANRKMFSVSEKHWNNYSDSAVKLKSLLIPLLKDWGVFLDTNIYKEALCHLYKTGKDIVQPVEIKSESIILGIQNIPLLSKTEGFCISSIRNGHQTYQTHLTRFLEHTNLKQMHWININDFSVELHSLSKKNHSDLNHSD